jgi:ribokinase
MSDTNPQIVVVGSHAPGLLVRVQRIPTAGETVLGWDLQEIKDGGKGSNQAIAAARLGVTASFVGCIGTDRLGAECEDWLREEGVDISHLYRSQSKGTGAGINIVDENGIPAMVTSLGANEELNCQQVETALENLRDAKVMLTQFEILPEVALYTARIAHRYKMTTIVNPAPAFAVNLSHLEVADVLIPNDVEAKVLLGHDPQAQIDLEILAQKLLTITKAGAVLITAGPQGVVGADRSGIWRVLPPKVTVVDTSGAGDVFCAAVAVGLIRGLDARAASSWACLVATLSVTEAGTIVSFPTAAEVDEFSLTLAKTN